MEFTRTTISGCCATAPQTFLYIPPCNCLHAEPHVGKGQGLRLPWRDLTEIRIQLDKELERIVLEKCSATAGQSEPDYNERTGCETFLGKGTYPNAQPSPGYLLVVGYDPLW